MAGADANEISARAEHRAERRAGVSETLVYEHGLAPTFAVAVAAKVDAMDADLRTAFEIWLYSGTISPICVEGLSVEALMTSYRMTTIVAFLMLDHLRRDPKRAFAALQKRSEPAAFVIPPRRVPIDATPAVRHLRVVPGPGRQS